MMHRPFTLLIHIALAIILAGAIVTHYCGIQGELELSQGGAPTDRFQKESGPGDGRFPFFVALQSAEIDYYPGTTTPMDFRSNLNIGGKNVTVSMNNVAEIDGWRFYQSGISPDSTRLSISHDPWGTGITYTGYSLLLLSMVAFFFQRKTPWRALLKASKKAMPLFFILIAFSANAQTDESLPTMQRPLATNMGKAYVYWNDRICPMQTMANDVTLKLYGSESYAGLTAEQVLSGWLFYFDTWERDFSQNHADAGDSPKQQKRNDERLALIQWLGTGEAFKIYPYKAASGNIEWLSLTGKRPSKMDLEQWKFMQRTMPEIKRLLLEGRNIAADSVITELINGQIRYAGAENLPSKARMQAERIYNSYANPFFAAVLALHLGIFFLYVAIKRRNPKAVATKIANTTIALLSAYTLAILALLWWIGGHMPLSNGPEMMLFMSFFSLLCSLPCKGRMLKGSFLIVAAMTLFVAVIGGRTPQIGMLMPVLASPLLSIHVMLVMTAYVFFLIMAILSAIGLATKDKEMQQELCRTNRIILTPTVFLLAAGIFVGAVWANQSWGRYWGWDPKETCALVMLLVYSVPAHWGTRSLKAFRKPKVLHLYLLAAILTVLFTYFGANYFLSGLHSYA